MIGAKVDDAEDERPLMWNRQGEKKERNRVTSV